VANASGSRQTPEHGKIPDTFDQNGQFIFARAAGGGIVAALTPAPATPGPAPEVARVPPPANFTRLSSAQFAAPASPWQLRPEALNQPGAEQLPYHLAEKGAQIRILSSPMGAIEIAKAAPEFREDLVKSSLESFRTALEKAGVRGWKTGGVERTVVDGLDLYGMDASAGGLWVRASAMRNEADGRGYIILLTAPQKFQKDMVTEYQRILDSWKWTRK
jgi:hypothetical protein